MVKDTDIGGTRRLQFRAEVFNVFNRVNFAMPAGTIFRGATEIEAPLATAGRITSLVGQPRQMQLSLRFTF